ncbi:MAG: LytTR family transcriptional regulator [Lachnospira sp.]|nr:LytTR family transcriptional regulator [Lachnospira sp.]
MKIRLAVDNKDYDRLRAEFEALGIEVNDDAEYILTKKDEYINNIMVKKEGQNEYIRLSVEDIVCIETFGHKVVVYDENQDYLASERLYQLCNMLNPDNFLRISNSVLIATHKVKKIKPTFSMKYILTMSNGKNVDVTRSYYNLFRDYYKI